MKMISYKEFKQLNESLGFNLGLKTTQSVGLMGAHHTGETKTAEEMFEEAKKKAKKRMLAGGIKPPVGDDDEDGEMVDPSAIKDDPDAEVDSDDVTGDDDIDNDDTDDEDGADLENIKKFSKKKMSADGKCSKCSHSPCTCGNSKLHNHSLKNTDKKDKSGAHLEDTKKKYKEEFMEEMEKDFFASLKAMMAPPKARDFRPVSEEILFNPSDPNFGLVSAEPTAVASAGSVGFAPDTVIGQPQGGLGSGEGFYEGVKPVKKK